MAIFHIQISSKGLSLDVPAFLECGLKTSGDRFTVSFVKMQFWGSPIEWELWKKSPWWEASEVPWDDPGSSDILSDSRECQCLGTWEAI